jgi:hypothetical protein
MPVIREIVRISCDSVSLPEMYFPTSMLTLIVVTSFDRSRTTSQRKNQKTMTGYLPRTTVCYRTLNSISANLTMMADQLCQRLADLLLADSRRPN